MPKLPTYEQILERVKAQDWGHVCHLDSPHEGVRCECLCGVKQVDYKFPTNHPCEVRIAQAIQAAMVEAQIVTLREWYKKMYYTDDVASRWLTQLRETADALEKQK